VEFIEVDMESVETQFVLNPQKNENAAGDADRKPYNVNQ
jgi:hypothetical protein